MQNSLVKLEHRKIVFVKVEVEASVIRNI